MSKTVNKGSGRMRKQDLAARILEFLQMQNKQSFNYKQIAFGIPGPTESRTAWMLSTCLMILWPPATFWRWTSAKYKAKANRGTENVGYFCVPQQRQEMPLWSTTSISWWRSAFDACSQRRQSPGGGFRRPEVVRPGSPRGSRFWRRRTSSLSALSG